MEDSQRLEKNQLISERGRETRMRHKSMRCTVVTLKVVMNKLNRLQKEQMYGQFREAKWINNSMIGQSKEGKDIFSFTDKDFITVDHLDKDKNVLTDEIKYLSRREVQSVVSGVKGNIKALAAAKKKGHEVGELRFISEYTSIDLPQYIKSYKIVGRNKIKLDKIAGAVRVRGLNQLENIEERYEIANAKVINRPDGFYIAITLFIEPSENDVNKNTKPLIGLDMGCETSLTFSNGDKINLEVRETERLKKLQRSLARCKKGSNNRMDIRRKLRAEYQHMSNKKDDLAKKVLHKLNDYRVVMQDEQLSGWQETGHGKKIAHGVLGRVKAGLEARSDTYVLSKWIPTTRMCTECGCKVSMSVSDREFVCPECGCCEDRDVHAAKNMLWFFSKRETLCVERTEYNREEFEEGIRDMFVVTSHETTKSSA